MNTSVTRTNRSPAPRTQRGVRLRRQACAILWIGLAASTALAEENTVTGDRGSDMMIDLIVMRPIGLVTTVVGAAAFVVSLPFTAMGGNVSEAAHELVGKPVEYTFQRPLGEFYVCPDGRSGQCKPMEKSPPPEPAESR